MTSLWVSTWDHSQWGKGAWWLDPSEVCTHFTVVLSPTPQFLAFGVYEFGLEVSHGRP